MTVPGETRTRRERRSDVGIPRSAPSKRIVPGFRQIRKGIGARNFRTPPAARLEWDVPSPLAIPGWAPARRDATRRLIMTSLIVSMGLALAVGSTGQYPHAPGFSGVTTPMPPGPGY